MKSIYIEAIVSAENHAFMSVASSVISNTPKAVTENLTGEEAFQYIRKVDL